MNAEKIPKGRGFLYKCGDNLYGIYKRKRNGTKYLKCVNKQCSDCPGTAKMELGQQLILLVSSSTRTEVLLVA